MKNLLYSIIVVFVFMFSQTIKAQNSTKSTLTTAAKNNLANTKITTKKEKSVLSTSSKMIVTTVKKKKTGLPKKNGGDTPKLGLMNKKEK